MALRRTLGWPALAAYGLGSILGAGIYSVIGGAAARAGEAMWLAFVVGAFVALLTALSYAELATMFPRAGAEFVYVGHAMPRQRAIAFTAGTMTVASNAATAATVAIAFAGYLSAFVDAPVAIIAPLLVAVLAGVAIVGVKESTIVVAIFTGIEVVGLIIVIAVGATSETFGAALATAPTANVLPAAALVFFSYLGFQGIVNLAEETERPERDLTRAIMTSLAIATALYIAVALAAVALLPIDELAASEAPLADAVRARSPLAASALGAIALFATANTAMAAIVSGSRMLYAMAEARELPPALARVGTRRETPWVATLVIAGLAVALLPLGGVEVIASVSSFAALLAFAAVSTSVIVLRFRDPSRARPFRVPLAIGALPVLPALGAIAALALVTQLAPIAILCGGALIVVSLVAHRLLRRWR